MGYNTDFCGEFKIKELIPIREFEYFNRFCNTRHMQLNTEYLKEHYPKEVEKYSLNGYVGHQGMWYAPGNLGPNMDDDNLIINFNRCSTEILKRSENSEKYASMLWCDFVLESEDYDKNNAEIQELECVLKHNDAEKTYDYFEWLKFLCKTLLRKYTVNGVLVAMGEETGDINIIVIINTTPSLFHSTSNAETFIKNSNITSEEKEILLSELYTNYFEPDWWYDSEED